MTKLVQLLKKFNDCDQATQEQVKNLITSNLKEREIAIIREFYGIDRKRLSPQQIGNTFGLGKDEVVLLVKKARAIIEAEYERLGHEEADEKEEDRNLDEKDAGKLPESEDNQSLESIDKKEEEYQNPNLNVLLYKFPAFNELRKKKSGPLARYAKVTLAQFIADYNYKGLKGKAIYDELMAAIAPGMMSNEPEESMDEPLNTVFPSSFDENEPIGKAYKQMVVELVDYLEKEPYFVKNKTRAKIANLYFNLHKSSSEIKKDLGISIPTITDNFLTPLLKEGSVDELSLNPLFKESVDKYISSNMYSPLQKIKDELQLDSEGLLCFLFSFGADVFNKSDYCSEPIIIHKGDIYKVKECISKFFEVLSDAILPIPKDEFVSRLKSVVDTDKWLPELIEAQISSNDSVRRDAQGNLYLSDEKLISVTQRVCRIIYKSPSHTVNKKHLDAVYFKLYGKKLTGLNYKEMEARGFYNPSDGVYQYSPGKKPQSVHDYIDNYISTNILIKWSSLLVEIKKINPVLKEGSERTYTTQKCSVCSTDSDILVLKGHEGDYPQYQWKDKYKTDKTNFFINQAVDILKKQPDCEMTYKEFLSQLNRIIRKNNYSDHTTGSVIKKYTDDDPKLFIRENNNIRLDQNVLANVALDYIGFHYKYSDFYLSIYALAISELKSKPDHKILRSELAALASTQISDEINGRIVNKAFTDRAKPQMLYIEGSGKGAYICLDMSQLDIEVAKDEQYKVAADDSTSQSDSAPKMVVDTQQRDVTYRQVFKWDAILTMLKRDLKHYDKSFFYQGISSDDVLQKFRRFMSQSNNLFLNTLIPQAYYELSYANVDQWSSYDYRSKITRAFESLLMDIYYQNRGVESQTKGLREIMELAFPEYLNARKNFDRTGFNGILNNIYNDRIHFAHPTMSEMPTLLNNIQAFISYMALYVYTVAKYYKG